MTEEYFDVLDENGNKTGVKKLRGEVHCDGDWHRSAHIWILNGHGDVLLQRRCPTKDSNPNMLDISCAGHLEAGDDSLAGAVRELKEELGLDVTPEDLQFIKTFKVSKRYTPTFFNQEFQDMYILRTDKAAEDMEYQESEISEIMFVSYRQFKKMVENRQPDLLIHEDEMKTLFALFDPEFA